MDTGKLITYGVSLVLGLITLKWPQLSNYTLPAITGFAGWATTHPSDTARIESLTQDLVQAVAKNVDMTKLLDKAK